MKSLKQIILITLLFFCYKTNYAQISDSISVSQNPFCDSTIIHFEIAQSDTITLKLYNRWGQCLITFFQSVVLPSGSYNINLYGNSLADDFYVIKLDIGSSTTIGKVVAKNCATSVIEHNNFTDNNIAIFPNPTNDFITIPINENKAIIITSLDGKLVKSLTTNNRTISISDLASGQYFISVFNNKNENIITKKIIKSE